MGFLSWIVLGLISGFIASRLYYRAGSGFLMDVLLGVVGAVVGGWVMSFLNKKGVTGLNFHSILVSVVGAIAVLWVYNRFIW